MKRKQFLKSIAATGLTMGSLPLMAGNSTLANDPQLDRSLVQAFVGAGHRDMDKVKELLAEHPTLLNAAHDWEYGDFETCLGAASHVGYKELAQFLIDQGAQGNIFTACLFGKLEIVRPMLKAFPALLHAKGPHGFTLLHHAVKGGEEALAVKDFLESLGALEMKVKLF